MLTMLVDGTHGFRQISELDFRGETRTYYLASSPYYFLLVCRHGLKLSNLNGFRVNVKIGTETGVQGFCRVEGVEHKKITIMSRSDARDHDTTLSRQLRQAPRDE